VSLRRLAILVAWTFAVILITGAALFLFTYGDCFENETCKRATNRNFLVVAGAGFVLYWVVFLALVRKWTRDV
jgi:Co/Zn/Cd efflux system component